MKIKLLRTTDKDFSARFAKIRERGGVFEKDIITIAEKIIDDVRRNGDAALRKYAKRFGDLQDGSEPLLVTPQEIEKAARKVSRTDMAVLKLATRRITAYHKHQKESGYAVKEDGALMGQKVLPLGRVGIYAPGGQGSYPSTILMAAIPARVAGVKEIILCSPQPRRGGTGEINPYIAAAAQICRVDKFFRIGGAQAIAALAYGTATIPNVDKIVGPGNAYVASAKRLVYGRVDIDMVAGPSEVLIIADDSASPAYIAADMLAQAEHDAMASSLLVTPSEGLAVEVAAQIALQLGQIGDASVAKKSLARFGAAIIVRDLNEAINIANEFAPEHLEVMTKNASSILNKIKNAGSVFLGQYTPEALGDYIAGVNHILPTSGTARFASPLGVYDFTKRMSFLSFTRKAFLNLAKETAIFADAEGLTAHANSVRVRQAGKSKVVL